jgi:hypothetical protein
LLRANFKFAIFVLWLTISLHLKVCCWFLACLSPHALHMCCHRAQRLVLVSGLALAFLVVLASSCWRVVRSPNALGSQSRACFKRLTRGAQARGNSTSTFSAAQSASILFCEVPILLHPGLDFGQLTLPVFDSAGVFSLFTLRKGLLPANDRSLTSLGGSLPARLCICSLSSGSSPLLSGSYLLSSGRCSSPLSSGSYPLSSGHSWFRPDVAVLRFRREVIRCRPEVFRCRPDVEVLRFRRGTLRSRPEVIHCRPETLCSRPEVEALRFRRDTLGFVRKFSACQIGIFLSSGFSSPSVATVSPPAPFCSPAAAPSLSCASYQVLPKPAPTEGVSCVTLSTRAHLASIRGG